MSDPKDFARSTNRPANNARQVTPGQILHTSHTPTTDGDVEDFLGLNQDLQASPAPEPHAAAPMPAPAAAPAALPVMQQDESWFMELAEEERLVVDSSEPTEIAFDDAPEDERVELPATMLNTSWQERERPRRPAKRWLIPLVGASVLGALGIFGLPLLRKGSTPEPDESTAKPMLARVPSGPTPVADAPALEVEPPSESGPAMPLAAALDPSGALSAPVETNYEAPVEAQVDRHPARAREEVSASSNALEDGGLVEVVDPGPAWNIVGECEEQPAAAAEAQASLATLAPEARPEPEPLTAVSDEPETAAAEVVSVATDDEPEVLAEDLAAVATPVEPGLLAEDVASAATPDEPEVFTGAATDAGSAAAVARLEPEPIPEPRTSEVGPAVARTEPSAVAIAAPAPPSENSTAAEPTPVPAPADPGFIGVPIAVAAPRAEVQPLVGPSVPGTASPGPPAAELVARASARTRITSLGIEDVLLINEGASQLRTATGKDLSGLWTETRIPTESISSKTKVLTPAVGKVRAILTGGEIFEGNLYAVGEGCVWIDTKYGRMGLDGARVKTIAQIDTPKGAPTLGSPGSQDLGGMQRVRIKTPGGTLYGKLVDRDGDRATVVTDEGARLTVPSKDVEPLTEAPKVQVKGG